MSIAKIHIAFYPLSVVSGVALGIANLNYEFIQPSSTAIISGTIIASLFTYMSSATNRELHFRNERATLKESFKSSILEYISLSKEITGGAILLEQDKKTMHSINQKYKEIKTSYEKIFNSVQEVNLKAPDNPKSNVFMQLFQIKSSEYEYLSKEHDRHVMNVDKKISSLYLSFIKLSTSFNQMVVKWNDYEKFNPSKESQKKLEELEKRINTIREDFENIRGKILNDKDSIDIETLNEKFGCNSEYELFVDLFSNEQKSLEQESIEYRNDKLFSYSVILLVTAFVISTNIRI
ncbi:hypothetical protein GCM10027040_05350 [Halomonas shantousis]